MLIDDNINIKFKKNWLTYKGLTSQQVEINRQKYGTNVLKPPKRDPWWKLFLEKFEDPVIQILSVAAVIAIAVGMAQGEYIEGVGIIVAILLATILAFVNEYKANQEFDILNRVSDTVAVKVIRDGTFTTVPRQDLVVGDIIYLEQGEEVPADGLILEEIAFYVDQSKLTGESEPVQKTTKDNLETSITEVGTYPAHRVYRSTLVNHGSAYIEITEVGDRTEIGKLAIAVAVVESEEITPLNLQLEKLSKFIGVVGLGFAVLTFAALLIRGFALGEYSLDSRQCYFFALSMVSALIALTPIWLPVIYDGFELAGKDVESPEWLEADGFAPWLQATGTGLLCLGLGVCLSFFLGFDPATAWIPGNLANALLHYFMVAVTIIVVAVPEGLAMSVTLSLAYSMRKMAKDNNLVRQMHACETIGAATVICSDKTGTLTLNQMQVKEVNFPSFNSALPQAREDAKHLIAEAFAVNSTAELETLEKQSSRPIGNVTEGALLLWLDKENLNYATYRKQFDLQQRIPFSTQRKYMATLGTSPLNKEPVLYVKGAPEVILSKCDRILSEDGLKTLDKANKNEISDSLTQYQQKAMRTIGFAYSSNPETINEDNVKSLGYGAYKQARKAEGSSAEVSSAVYEPRPETARTARMWSATDHIVSSPRQQLEVSSNLRSLNNNLTWLGFVAIEDPLRPDVPNAIAACLNSGIQVKIVTGDTPETAKEIARQIGITSDTENQYTYLTGVEFAQLSDEQAQVAVKELKVLSRARPLDKLRLVRLLQKNGEVVSVTGDGTNDAAALKQAQVGLAMGSGTAIALEASDIILLDDSFSSIVNSIIWGRSLYANIQKFILFQLTINVAALAIVFLGPFIGIELPLTVTQMLWVNLIMDTFAALALATEPPNPKAIEQSPRLRNAFIISPTMLKNILGVGLGFLVILTASLLYIARDGNISTYELSVFFTVFVLLQFWNLFNARCLDSNKSAFSGLIQNKSFIAIALTIFIGQILIIQFGGDVFRTVALSLKDWIAVVLSTSAVLWLGESWRCWQRFQSK